jgi:uncharacterized protein YkwD
MRSDVARRAGIAEPLPLVLLLEGRPAQQTELEKQLFDDLGRRCRAVGCNRLGAALAHHDDEMTIVVVALATRVLLEPVPARLDPGGDLHLRGQTERNVSRLEILVAPPQGPVASLFDEAEQAFDVTHRLDQRGTYEVELLGHVNGSPTVLALFSVAVGSGEVASREPPPGHTAGESEARHRVLELINAARQQAALPPLSPHDVLTETAQGHAAAMKEQNFFGHRNPAGQGPADRVAAQGLHSPLVLENLAFAATAEEAFASLRDSPAHWRAMMHPETNHAGIGVTLDGAGLYVVVLMSNVTDRLDGPGAAARVVTTINSARTDRDRVPLALVPELTAAAEEVVELLAQAAAAGQPPEVIEPSLRRVLAERQLPAVQALVVTTANLDHAELFARALVPEMQRAGLAVRPAQEQALGYHLVLLLGRE